jgi:AraC-like DNA-binding protein
LSNDWKMKRATRFTVQRGWKLIIADMGINPADVLKFARLPADLFARKDASLAPEEYFRFWRGLEQAAGTDELPLRIGQAISVEAFDPPIFASLCSPNLNVALQRLASFKPLIGPLTLDVTVGPKRTTVTLGRSGVVEPIPRSLVTTKMVFFTQLSRMATRKRIVPDEVALTELPSDTAPYESYFGCSLHRSKVNRIAFSARDASHPFLTEDLAMWTFFEAGLKQRLSDLDAEAGVSQRVRSVLLEMLPSGQCSIEEVAHRLAMSKRSLQRKLLDEEKSFQHVLNATRRELAQHYLSRSTISPGEISWLLGFRDSNSFIRAFRGWTGLTPGEYRTRRSAH